MPADAGRVTYRAAQPGEYVVDVGRDPGYHEFAEIREARPRAEIRQPLAAIPDENWTGEIHERQEADADGNLRIIHHETDGVLNLYWPDNGTGREDFVEQMPADRLVARRVAGRQLGLVQHPNPEAGYRIDYDPPGNVIPPIMPGEDADGPTLEETGANPLAANVVIHSAWAERNHTVPVEADVVISDENGEHYRPEVTHATARMDDMGGVTREVRAVDRYGVWEIRYVEEHPGNQVRVNGDAIIRRTPHQDTTVGLGTRGRLTRGVVVGARPWGTDTPTNFMWDVPILFHHANINRVEMDRMLHFEGADDILIEGGRALDEFLAAERVNAEQLNEAETRQRKEAESKAERLLRALLTPQQLSDYENKRCFYLQVNNELFRIDYGSTGNVKRINPENGEILESYCIHPSFRNSVPVQDVMLAQKLLLETDPEQFKKTANRWQAGPINLRGMELPPLPEIPVPDLEVREVLGNGVINLRNAEELVINNGEHFVLQDANGGGDVRIVNARLWHGAWHRPLEPAGEPQVMRLAEDAD